MISHSQLRPAPQRRIGLAVKIQIHGAIRFSHWIARGFAG
jgi:hypothetical protein